MVDDGEDIAYYVVLAALSFSVLVMTAILFFLWRKRTPSQDVEEEEGDIENTGTLNVSKACATLYSLTDIDTATDGFNPRRVIGEGELGKVYTAVLPGGGELVAVKRIHPRMVLSNAGFMFSSTMKWLSLAHHHNIVPILGYSEAPGERIILMEYVTMMSLDYHLHHNSFDQHVTLSDWSRRVRIAAGVARGIEYLHEVMAPPVVHGCVKPSNILIDVKYCAKVCDYGLSFLAPQERRRGAKGYVDRDCWVEKKGVSKECDVYGLGVVLLELLSGRRGSSEEVILVNWALPLIRDLRFSELLDPRIVIPSNMKPIVRFAKVASACVGNSRKNRPSIIQVAAILNNLEIELCS